VRTLFFASPAAGALGEVALLRAWAPLFCGPNEKFEWVFPESLSEGRCAPNGNSDWRFVFLDGPPAPETVQDALAVLLVIPTVHGLVRAQRQKNLFVLNGIPETRLAALLLFANDPQALPVPLAEKTLGVPVAAIDCSISHLFGLHNDAAPNARSLVKGLRGAAEFVRRHFQREAAPASLEIPWASIERDMLQSLWSAEKPGASVTTLSDEEILQRVRTHITACLARRNVRAVDAALLRELERRMIDRVSGLGPLEPLLRDPDVNEIMIVGRDRLYVERKGHVQRIPPAFDHETHLKTLIERIVAPSGRRVDWAAPFCDVRLNDGSRVNVVLPPLALDGPCVTIRRFRPGFATLDSLRDAGTIDDDQARALERAVLERRNIVIAGNTGAGKTTLMNVLASLIPDAERILTLEDAAELNLNKPHVVRLETRSANTEGKGQVTMRDLVVNALRMRPDRLLVGECRGEEVIPMLQAMNTGHDGSMTTLHANSGEEVAERLESLVSMSAPSWSLDLVRRQIRSAFDLIVYIKRDGARRCVTEIRDVV
jgi:pilus assembly protein CpaF